MHQKRKPIFQNVSRNLVKVSIFMSKMRRPAIPKLMNYYCNKDTNIGYRFLKEYEFSPPSKKRFIYGGFNNYKRKKKNKGVYVFVFLGRCFRGEEVRELDYQFSVETIPAPIGDCYLEPLDEEESVDERAEMFINRFYQEMKRERLEHCA